MSVVVLVGARPGALDAAERLGLEVVVVVEQTSKTATRARCVLEVDFGASAEAWRGVADQLGEADAVVALTERAVLPASHLRTALGLRGLSVESARLCSDKRAMKRAVRAAGLPCADFVEADDDLDADAIIERLRLPLVLKSAVGSGSRGTTVVRDRADVPDVLEDGWMAESFVVGVEMSVESFV
ncbi:ATP-grasp domain-containing protein, partial [Rubrivirga sp.]|uniref:ATP-grasp domain-containing protein n=1 Tax=Rubrivirga sp. TaxID=1885344 RepID=UPI003C72A83C